MAEIDEALRLGAKLLRRRKTRSPIGNHGRIEGGLVELVLQEYAPVAGQRRVNLAHRIEIAIERQRQVRLAREIGAVADPDGERFRAEFAADRDAVDIMGDRLRAHGAVDMGERAEFVGTRLPGLILERIGVHGVEGEATRGGGLAQRSVIARRIPGEMRRNRRRRTHELLDRRAIVELVEEVARLAGARKARKARAARADAPGRDRDAERHHLFDERFAIETAPAQHAREGGVIFVKGGRQCSILVSDEVGVDSEGHRQILLLSSLRAKRSNPEIVPPAGGPRRSTKRSFEMQRAKSLTVTTSGLLRSARNDGPHLSALSA